MRPVFDRLGLMLAAVGFAVVLMDELYINPEWSYGGALASVGLLVYLLTCLDRL